MQGTCRTLSSTKSKASTPTFPTKVCGVHLIRPLKNKLWLWLPDRNKTNPKAHRLPKKESTSKSPSKDKDKEKEKKGPPFAHKEGKLGDTKQWKGKTYYYCPANHKHSHWHTHKVEECNTYKKMIKQQNDNVSSSSSNNNHVTMDLDKVKQAMAALFPSGDFDTADLANALVAVLEGAS